jgi:hypothetical protein
VGGGAGIAIAREFVRVVRNATHASEDESRAARIALLPGLVSREQAHLRQALDHLPHVHDMLDQLLALRRMRSGGRTWT